MTAPSPLTEDEVKALRKMAAMEQYLLQIAERERALGWVGKNVRLIAGWAAVVITGWAAFTGALGSFLRSLVSGGPSP